MPRLKKSGEVRYATVEWTAEDVQTLRPEMTQEQAEEFLANNEKHIQSRLVELGWDVLQDLIGESNLAGF